MGRREKWSRPVHQFFNSSSVPQLFAQLVQPRDKSVKEVVGLRSTAKSLVVEDKAVLHLLSMESGIILGLPS